MFEAGLSQVVEAFLSQQVEQLLAEIKRRGPAAVDDALFWQQQEAQMRALLAPHLADIAYEGVRTVMQRVGSAGLGVNWNLANTNAASWAEQHAGDLVKRVTETTRRGISEQVAQWSRTGEGLPGLTDRIAAMKNEEGLTLFNPTRAKLIATTESTTTYASANAQAWAAAGYAPAAYHPAAHVGCRCYLQPSRLPDGTKVMIWYTARDERVCDTPVTTPWGMVDGCKGLHGVIVSSGPYMGRKLSDVRNG